MSSRIARTFASASIESSVPKPAEARSAAISTRSFQPPFAKAQKSSPGFTPGFCAERSTPKLPYFGLAVCAIAGETASSATPAARRTMLLIFILRIPPKDCVSRM